MILHRTLSRNLYCIVPTSSSAIEYSQEQQALLQSHGHAVVIAKPGSGKTTTIAEYIRRRLQPLPAHRGVIAISFTNKASQELSRRIGVTQATAKASFTGTIDSFFLTEIIIPFGRRIFGRPQVTFAIEKLDLAVHHLPEDRSLYDSDQLAEYLEGLGRLYRAGVIVLETLGFLGNYVLTHSLACRRYLRARYSYLIIDEYQDCGVWQHGFFLKAAAAGLTTVAVGDLDQSIFRFAGKSSSHLQDLANTAGFTLYPLTHNRRCHRSIVNYSSRLISPTCAIQETDNIRILGKRLQGDEASVGEWIGATCDRLMGQFNVSRRRELGILTRSSRTAELVTRGLGQPFHLAVSTPLDEDVSPFGRAVRDVLRMLFNPQVTRTELLDDYVVDATRRRAASEALTEATGALEDGLENVRNYHALIIQAARVLSGSESRENTRRALLSVLDSQVHMASLIPARAGEIQVMTIHKAKGLEFDLVFHMDLHKWILPNPYGDVAEDLNLHYVAITRARKACFFCVNMQRHRGDGRIVAAEDSPFLRRDGLAGLIHRTEF